MTAAERCRRRIQDKAAAERSLRVPHHLKAREVATEIRRRHPTFRGHSIWKTIGKYVRWAARES